MLGRIQLLQHARARLRLKPLDLRIADFGFCEARRRRCMHDSTCSTKDAVASLAARRPFPQQRRPAPRTLSAAATADVTQPLNLATSSARE